MIADKPPASTVEDDKERLHWPGAVCRHRVSGPVHSGPLHGPA